MEAIEICRREQAEAAVPDDLFVRDFDLKAVAEEMDRNGFCVLGGCVPDIFLSRARQVAVEATTPGLGVDPILIGPAALRHPVLRDLAEAPGLKALCRGLYRLAAGREAPHDDILPIYRCLLGPPGRRQSYRFHYDTHLVTVLAPVAIPTKGLCGDLLMFPNRRPVRRTYPESFIDKAIYCNPLSQRALRPIADRHLFGGKAIKMTPGNVYVFWGYRSLHCNEACDPDQLRATALLHYGDPHALSRSARMVKSLMRRH